MRRGHAKDVWAVEGRKEFTYHGNKKGNRPRPVQLNESIKIVARLGCSSKKKRRKGGGAELLWPNSAQKHVKHEIELRPHNNLGLKTGNLVNTPEKLTFKEVIV